MTDDQNLDLSPITTEAERGGRRQSDKDYTLLLGQILGKVGATEKHIAQQNGTLARVDKTTADLALQVAKLPCDVQSERLKNHIEHCENNGTIPKTNSPWRDRSVGGGAGAVLIIIIAELGQKLGWW